MRLLKHYTNHEQHEFAKQLRRNSAPVEQKFWAALRQTLHPLGFKFRRQQPLVGYVVDFANMKAKLVIELDGWSHDNKQDYDAARDARLTAVGYKVMRFTNDQINNDIASVLAMIAAEAQSRIDNQLPTGSADADPLPQPLPQGEGGTGMHP